MNVQSKRTLLGTLTVQVKQEGTITIDVKGRRGPFGGTRFEVLVGGDDMEKATGFSTPRSVRTKTANEAYSAVETLIIGTYPRRNSVLYSVMGGLNDVAHAIEATGIEPALPQ